MKMRSPPHTPPHGFYIWLSLLEVKVMTGSLKAAPSPLERYVQYSLIQGPLLAGCPEESARFGKWAGARLGRSFSVRLGWERGGR